MANKLELTWYGKENQVNVEPRILIEDKTLSNVVNGDTENMLIHGDNLLALKALEKEFAGKIKCIYIDPPYNTGSAFEHYDDNLEHSTWLSLMKERLVVLKKLLADDGLIFVQIDDNEQAYLKVLMDEIFTRKNFVNCIAVKMSEASGVKMAHVEKRLPKLKEYILVYKKNEIRLNDLKIEKPTWDEEYKTLMTNISKEDIEFIKRVINDENRTITDIDMARKLLDSAEYESTSSYFQKNLIKNDKEKNKLNFENSWRIFQTVSMGSGTTQAINESRLKFCKNKFFVHITNKNKMYIIKGDYDLEKKKPRIQVLFADEYLTYNPGDLWTDIKTTGLDNEGAGIDFKNSKKPEMLIKRIIDISTKPGDIVLDSFLGSGTTAAVAHKMGRRYIGIEMGDHAYTHCKVRLDKVIEGEQGGISKAVNWQGGGGYRFYELAPTLINEDAFGQKVISTDYNSDMLAAAIALHEGYKYEPDNTCYWKQSHSEDNSYLFVTTNHISREIIDSIKTELKDDEFLLISCKSFDSNSLTGIKNISIKKIPQSLLSNCEFGVDNYSLNIVSPPVYEEEEDNE